MRRMFHKCIRRNTPAAIPTYASCVRHRVALGHGKLQAPGWAGATVGADAVCLLPQRAKLPGRVPGRDVLAGETVPDAARKRAAETSSAAGSVRTAGAL
jgi:hypothetical protein